MVNTPSPPDNPPPVHFDPDSLPLDPPLYPPPSSTDQHEPWTPPPPEQTTLIYPVFLLYPSHSQSDFITHFSEETSVADHLAVMFPSSAPSSEPPFPAWDTKREYHSDNLVVYVETAHRRLLKVGRDLTLREVIRKAVKPAMDGKGVGDGVILRDGLLSLVVLVKGEREKEWIDQYKRSRDGAKS